MRQSVENAIVEHALISPGDTVLAGLSGGPDSVALLHVLLRIAPSMGFTVEAAHLNHCLRAEASDKDEAFVRELCELLGVRLYVERADVAAFAKEQGYTVEQAGREMRYAFLERCAGAGENVRIALAHHMDDQAESILLHLTRGAGLAGLIGMLPRRGRIIRPLLYVRRADVEAYLAQEGLAYCVDATNLEAGGTRNRLRLHVVPYIEQYINPAFVRVLCSMGELALRDERYLEEEAAKALERTRRDGGFDRAALKALPLPLLTRALRIALREAGAENDVERVHIESLIELLGARTGARLGLPGAKAYTDYGLLRFGEAENLVPYFEIPLNMEGETPTPLGSFFAETLDAQSLDPAEFGRARHVAYMDMDALGDGADLVIRLRRGGERIHPVGAPGRKKLKEYFIDRKVPRQKRALPLLCRGDEVLFLPGFCSAQSTRIGPKSRRALRLRFVPHTPQGGADTQEKA